MTPDQSLKAAILGEDVPARNSARDQPDSPQRRAAKGGPSRVFRLGMRILALTVLIVGATTLLNRPEAQAALAKAKTVAWDLIAAYGPKTLPGETASGMETPQSDPASAETAPSAPPGAAPPVSAPGAPGSEAIGAPVQADTAPVSDTGESAKEGSRISGAVTAIRAGNLLDVAEVTVLIDDLACPSPESEDGRLAALGLARVTRGATLDCAVLGEVGDAALRASCMLPDGRAIAAAMVAETACR